MFNLGLGRRLLGALLLVTFVGLLAPACGVFLTHRQPRADPASRVLVLRSEANEIDGWNATPVANDAERGCPFWQSLEAVGGRSKRMQGYLRVRTEHACTIAHHAALAREEERRREEKRMAELRDRAEREVTSGACSADNAAMLEAWALFIKDTMKLRFDTSRQAKWFTFVGHQVVVANEDGVSVQLNPWMTGELHLFAFGRLPVTLDVRASSGTPTTLASPWEKQVAYRCAINGDCLAAHATDPPTPEARASRVVLAQGSARFDIDVHGQGCVLVMGFAGI